MSKQNKKILIVEDVDITASHIAEQVLEFDATIDIQFASNGLDAYKQLQKEDVDLVFTDWEMPHYTGLELIIMVRSDLKKETPFVLISGKQGTSENIEKAKKYGVDIFLGKDRNTDSKITEALQRYL